MPIVACGISNDARAAVAAIRAGAKEYIPLPPDPGTDRGRARRRHRHCAELIYRDEAGWSSSSAQQIAASDAGHDHRRSGTGKEVLALCPHPLEPRQAAVHLDDLRGDPST